MALDARVTLDKFVNRVYEPLGLPSIIHLQIRCIYSSQSPVKTSVNILIVNMVCVSPRGHEACSQISPNPSNFTVTTRELRKSSLGIWGKTWKVSPYWNMSYPHHPADSPLHLFSSVVWSGWYWSVSHQEHCSILDTGLAEDLENWMGHRWSTK